MNLSAIPAGDETLNEVNVGFEVPVGGEPVKNERDEAAAALFVDRFLHTPMRYLGNCGFIIPNTLSEDGNPYDVLVANTRAIQPGAVLRARSVGVLLMEDEQGTYEKIIAVPATCLTRRYDAVRDHIDVPEITREQLQHFKDLSPASGRGSSAGTARRRLAG